MATRFWFKVSALYNKGPFTFVGILGTSWEDAKEKALGLPEASRHLAMPNSPHFLSCNVIDVAADTRDADPAPVQVVLPTTT